MLQEIVETIPLDLEDFLFSTFGHRLQDDDDISESCYLLNLSILFSEVVTDRFPECFWCILEDIDNPAQKSLVYGIRIVGLDVLIYRTSIIEEI